MFWRNDKPKSLLFKLSFSYVFSFFIILSIITILLYPALNDLLVHATKNNQATTFALTNICLNNLFISMWIAAGLSMILSLMIAKRSLSYLAKYSDEIGKINENALSRRIKANDYPKELDSLSSTCNLMLSRIDSKMNKLKEFSASMAHELKNPLHFLQTATEVTLSKAKNIEDYQTLLEAHLEEYQHLSKLIDDLLFLSRADTQKLDLTLKEYNANEVMETILDYYQYAADLKNITIKTNGDMALCIDLPLFKRVLANILDNAIKFSDEGGTVNIHFQHTRDEKSITVIDTGCGINKEDLPYLADGFYQAHKEKCPTNKGVGLGLMITKAIVRQHNADLVIDSSPNAGTSVKIIFNTSDL